MEAAPPVLWTPLLAHSKGVPKYDIETIFRIEEPPVGFGAPKGMLRKGLGWGGAGVTMRELDRALWDYSKVHQQ